MNPGEAFWHVIEDIIRNHTIRFLPIISEAYLKKVKIKGGVWSELSLAGQIQRDIERFIIPLKADDSSHTDVPIQIIGIDSVDFSDNWGRGLEELVDAFKKDSIASNSNESALQFWYASMKITNEVQDREETYYTNWFNINIPEFLYAHFVNLNDGVELEDIPFHVQKQSGCLLSFADEQPMLKYATLRKPSVKIPFRAAFDDHAYEIDTYNIIANPRSTILWLLNKTIEKYFDSVGFSSFSFSSRNRAFYIPLGYLDTTQVSLKHLGLSRRALSGTARGVNWYYAVSFNYLHHPTPLLVVNHHVIFKSTDDKPIKDQLKYRRSVPSGWYNKEWLERLLAIMYVFSNMTGKIVVNCGTNAPIVIDAVPLQLFAQTTYEEP